MCVLLLMLLLLLLLMLLLLLLVLLLLLSSLLPGVSSWCRCRAGAVHRVLLHRLEVVLEPSLLLDQHAQLFRDPCLELCGRGVSCAEVLLK